jgi:arylsulfatase A-like enzyme
MMDAGVGRLMDYLRDRGLLENTIVVYCADHGDFGGEKGQIGKNALGGYEPVYRVPLMWSWEGQFGKDVVREMVENVDFFPTVCDLAGVDVPAKVQGESYAHPLRWSAAASDHRPFEGKESVFLQDNAVLKTVRTRTHKLSYRFDGQSEKGELYDLTTDPYERVNLFDDPAYAHVQEKLLRKIINHMIRTEQPRSYAESRKAAPPWRWFQKNFKIEGEVKPDMNRVPE